MNRKNTYLSKSSFIRGLQCHKSLWLYKHSPEIRTEPSPSQELAFEGGKEVGLLAHGLFPGGREIEYEGGGISRMLSATKKLIEGGAKTLYEATLRHDGVLVMVDILRKGRKGWEIYEVKSSTEVKDHHLFDLAIQYYALGGLGLDISKACLVHINKEFVRDGEIDPKDFFLVADLTDEVRDAQKFVEEELLKMRKMLGKGCPDIDIGPQCNDPYECDFIDHCWAHIPEGSIFELREKGIDKFAYYRNGIVHIAGLDLDELNDKQRMQAEVELTGKEVIDRDAIREFLSTLRYPLSFLDFETFRMAIPPFDGLRPYEQIPFQYSIHTLEKEGGGLRHDEFLAEPGKDPREELVRGLVRAVPKDACVVVYNKVFEQSVIRSLAETFPEHAKKLLRIHDNIVDLMVPFRKRHYYTREMKGSYSLKYVLPALLPELSYDSLAITNGDDAMVAYLSLQALEDKDEIDRIRKDLLAYCGLDTLAMVELLKKLKSFVR